MTVAIRSLSAGDVEVVTAAVMRYPFTVLWGRGGHDVEGVAAHVAATMAGLADTPEGCLLGGTDGDATGYVGLQYLPFESGIYGRRMGCLYTLVAGAEMLGKPVRSLQARLLEAALTSARDLGYSHLACRVPTEDRALANALEGHGFRLMDTTLEFTWDTRRIQIEEDANSWVVAHLSRRQTRIPKFGTTVREARESDIASLRELAAEAFTARTITRYTADPTLPVGATGRLYSEWVELSVRGEFASAVRVGEYASEGLVGFTTIKRDSSLSRALGFELADMGIAALRQESRGSGVFPLILLSVVHWCAQNGVLIARGRVLCNNYEMQSCCLGTGASITAAFHSFHAHLSGDP
jgi:GNAT superfamily N-acetyltransferase